MLYKCSPTVRVVPSFGNLPSYRIPMSILSIHCCLGANNKYSTHTLFIPPHGQSTVLWSVGHSILWHAMWDHDQTQKRKEAEIQPVTSHIINTQQPHVHLDQKKERTLLHRQQDKVLQYSAFSWLLVCSEQLASDTHVKYAGKHQEGTGTSKGEGIITPQHTCLALLLVASCPSPRNFGVTQACLALACSG